MKRTGSLSPSSRGGQATQPSPPARSLNHSTNRVVLPKPAGVEISVSLRLGSRSSFAVRRDRATSFGRVWEGRSLVDTSESLVSGTWLTSGVYSTCDRTLLAIPEELNVVQTTVVHEVAAPLLTEHLTNIDHISLRVHRILRGSPSYTRAGIGFLKGSKGVPKSLTGACS